MSLESLYTKECVHVCVIKKAEHILRINDRFPPPQDNSIVFKRKQYQDDKLNNFIQIS